ncbi:MAG: hypothetical protein H0W58_17950 [Acidobacteria bacterium]|jgi:antitoxin YefM|nr:hypothetical protein [Acidobacteriota bacterium]
MITGIREKTIVKEGGKVKISSSDLPIGVEAEVIVLVEEEEQDTTEYLLSTEPNRRHLEEAMRDAQDPKKLIYIDIENLCKRLLSLRMPLNIITIGQVKTERFTPKSPNS